MLLFIYFLSSLRTIKPFVVYSCCDSGICLFCFSFKWFRASLVAAQIDYTADTLQTHCRPEPTQTPHLDRMPDGYLAARTRCQPAAALLFAPWGRSYSKPERPSLLHPRQASTILHAGKWGRQQDPRLDLTSSDRGSVLLPFPFYFRCKIKDQMNHAIFLLWYPTLSVLGRRETTLFLLDFF